ncbi:restriction endonuclease subunit S [Aeromonas sp. FDAARGOS 1414]|uniref:restriction endonuclease subunit S n=1 Tax=unclassified Aeromonas TaxID=257493 RepID=UPI001C225A7C|nr:restriction endonuclease subunit S [Aeromonas sp. FDAARGOS 1414]QWZ80976.1 restriction endonuclease subunit S [Aeromonas sp. FDAARGOS 1414]
MAIESLITDHLDLWTAAVRPKSSAGRGSNSKLELTGIKKLRELILELAVRGKLVPQDPSDEPASALLERIAAEKARLVKEGKIKKPKALPEIAEDEKPFGLPEGWEWVKLGDIGYDHGQKTPDSSFTYIDVGAINKEMGFIDSPTVMAASDAPSRARKIVKSGTIIYSTIRPYLLNIAVIDEDMSPEPIASTAFAIIHPFDGVLSRYVYRYLRSPCFVTYVENVQTGIAYPAINDKQFFNGIIPLPPTEEQHRIVAKVDELMALCDQLELRSESQLAAHQTLVETFLATLTDSSDADELAQNWARLSTHFDTFFSTEASIDALKQTILQLAVMGKLVPQDPSDEPASALLERIAAEKAQLVKEKKIKKEKPLPAISEDEKLFELPLGWVWSRISESSLFCEYGSSEKTVSELSDGVPVLKMGDIQDGKVILGSHQVVSPKIDDLPNLYLKKGDILYNRTNSAELVGKTGMFDGDDDTYTFASYLIRIRCSIHNIRPEYLTLCMNSPLFRKTQIEPHIKQQCGQANVNGTLMKSMLVSIPPYHEQVLILQKIHELMTLCDQLKSRLQTSQQTQLALAESLVEGALA